MIKTVHDDIWDFYGTGWDVIVPTTAYVNADGAAVMGRGVALQAKKLFLNLEYVLGEKIKKYDSHVFYFPRQRFFTFPTKDNWKNKAELSIIENSCKELSVMWKHAEEQKKKEIKIAMPKVGCGWGGLDWEIVAPLINKYFGDIPHEKFLIVDNESGNTREYKGKNPNSEKDNNSDYQLFIDPK